MTTAPKPLPPHGTYARANGCPGYRPPCHCEPCTTTRRAKKKQERVNRQLGRTAHCDPTAARQRLDELRQTMGWNDIAKAVDTSAAHLREIANGRVPRIKKTTHSKIMAVRPTPTGGLYVDATGTIRRLRALQAIGHSLDTLAAACGTHKSRIQPLVQGRPRLRQKVAERVKHAYETLARQPGTSARPRNRAAAEGWAPPGAWDDDTIDDPAALPEWTGHCGTDRGYWTHRQQKLPMCDRCQNAHDAWLTEHAHLGGLQRNQLQFAARAAASTREADLAADGRELMRFGASYEQAAERLGVTRQHLQQALIRHPEQQLAA